MMIPSNPSESPSLASMLSTLDRRRDASRGTIERSAIALIPSAAYLDPQSLLQVLSALGDLGTTAAFRRNWQRAVDEARKKLQHPADGPTEQSISHPYYERDNCLFIALPGNAGQREEQPVASFTARITAEIKDETGNRWFRIEGKTFASQPFTIILPVADFCDHNRLNTAIVAAAGITAVVYAGRARHVGPAIQYLTTQPPAQISRFNHTGWMADSFLIKGMVQENLILDLPDKLPYQVDPDADLIQGMRALESLVYAQTPEKVLVALTVAFQAPLALPMGWRSERYGVFLTGQTGTYKTSIAVLLLALFGAGFLDENNLIRWGTGSTVNSVINYATHANDLPLLVDNFKPNTGQGQRNLINVIHAIMEGGEKDRLNRTYTLQAARPIYAWPVFTGEDTASQDPASLARMLVIDFERVGPNGNSALTEAQDLAPHLNAVGFAWLQWLASDAAQRAVSEVKAYFNPVRNDWLTYLKNAPQQSVNAARIATNLTTNQLTWMVLEHHPTLADFAVRFRVQHRAGLRTVADKMAQLTAQALEGNAFLETIQELLTSGRSHLLPAFVVPAEDSRAGFIGWRGADGSYYLLPQLARQAVEGVMHSNGGLNQLSNHALYSQLDGLGLIQSYDRGGSRHCKTIRNNQGKSQKVLHLAAHALETNA